MQAAQHETRSQTKSMLRRSQHSLRKSTTLHGSDSANNCMRIANRRKTTQSLKKHQTHVVTHVSRCKHMEQASSWREMQHEWMQEHAGGLNTRALLETCTNSSLQAKLCTA